MSIVMLIESFAKVYQPVSPWYAMSYSLAVVGSVSVLLYSCGKTLSAIERLALQRFYALCLPIVLTTLSYFSIEFNYNPLKPVLLAFPNAILNIAPTVVQTLNQIFNYPWITTLVNITRSLLTAGSLYLPYSLAAALFVFVSYHVISAFFRLCHRSPLTAIGLKLIFKYGLLLLFGSYFYTFFEDMIVKSHWLPMLLDSAFTWFLLVFPLARGI